MFVSHLTSVDWHQSFTSQLVFQFNRTVMRMPRILWGMIFMCFDISIRFRLRCSRFFILLRLFLYVQKTIYFKILILTHTTITSRRLSITKIVIFMRIVCYFLRYLGTSFRFNWKICLENSFSHLMVVCDLELTYSVVVFYIT